jgi:CRISPR-associated endonuclease/helicase Cas3
VALRWYGPDADDTALVSDARDVRPGDTLVLPVFADGWAIFGHIPDSEPIDRGDEAFQRSRDIAVLRLTAGVIAEWPPECRTATILRLVDDEALAEDQGALDEVLTDALSEVASIAASPRWLREAASHLAAARTRRVEAHPVGGWVVKGRRRLGHHDVAETITDEDDTASGIDGPVRDVTLAAHCQGVEEIARKFATDCGLPPSTVEAIGWAARWHDIGKADRRFQAMLRNMPRRAMAPDQPLLAKSDTVPRSVRARQFARERSGYPRGGRHELLSVRLAESRLDRLPLDCDRDLFIYLIASHHGHCRPLAPVVDDSKPEPVPAFEHLGETFAAASTATRLHYLDSGVAERFWKLVRRYGWWGLAYLEAILRLADHRRSEYEQENQEKSDVARA